MTRLIPGVIVMASLLGGVLSGARAQEAAPAPTARDVIEETTTAVSDLLANAELDKDERKRRFEKLMEERLDVDRVSRLVLNASWDRWTQSQKREFKRLLIPYLVKTYWKKIETGFLRIDILDDEPAAESSTIYQRVRTRVVTEGSDPLVEFVLVQRERDATWKVIDILVDDASQVQVLRDEFTPIVRREGPDKLLENLRQKTGR